MMCVINMSTFRFIALLKVRLAFTAWLVCRMKLYVSRTDILEPFFKTWEAIFGKYLFTLCQILHSLKNWLPSPLWCFFLQFMTHTQIWCTSRQVLACASRAEWGRMRCFLQKSAFPSHGDLGGVGNYPQCDHIHRGELSPVQPYPSRGIIPSATIPIKNIYIRYSLRHADVNWRKPQ